MQGEMQDKCGVVGIHSVDDSKDVSSLVYYCLYALQHGVRNLQEWLLLVQIRD